MSVSHPVPNGTIVPGSYRSRTVRGPVTSRVGPGTVVLSGSRDSGVSDSVHVWGVKSGGTRNPHLYRPFVGRTTGVGTPYRRGPSDTGGYVVKGRVFMTEEERVVTWTRGGSRSPCDNVPPFPDPVSRAPSEGLTRLPRTTRASRQLYARNFAVVLSTPVRTPRDTERPVSTKTH